VRHSTIGIAIFAAVMATSKVAFGAGLVIRRLSMKDPLAIFAEQTALAEHFSGTSVALTAGIKFMF
jgi:hypothetical protein